MIKIEIANTPNGWNLDLVSFDVVFVSVDDRPKSLPGQRPATGIHTITEHGRHRFPVFADQERRYPTLDSGNAPGGFRVARRDSIPDTPDVLPTFPANSVEESELQVVGLVTIPPVRDVHHVPRLKPFVLVNERGKWKLVLPPSHYVPR